MTRPTVACLIPAHDEAARIAGVLEAVLDHPLLTQVLVVDDGSTDGTAARAASLGAPVLRLERNGGKTAAIAAGAERLESDLVLMLDSDLLGLTAEAVTRLLEPVLAGRAEVSISLRGNAPLAWRALGIDYISGERVLPRRMLADAAALRRLPRFGLEVHLNRLWLAERCRVAVVRWPEVASPAKMRKHGVWRGLAGDAGMLRDIFHAVPPGELLRQILRMRRAGRLS